MKKTLVLAALALTGCENGSDVLPVNAKERIGFVTKVERLYSNQENCNCEVEFTRPNSHPHTLIFIFPCDSVKVHDRVELVKLK